MEERKILNGSLMRKYHSVPAQMFVNIPKTLPGGSKVIINFITYSYEIYNFNCLKINGTTTDKQNITLEMQSPTTQSLQGWIEVFGKAKSNDVFLCQDVRKHNQNSIKL